MSYKEMEEYLKNIRSVTPLGFSGPKWNAVSGSESYERGFVDGWKSRQHQHAIECGFAGKDSYERYVEIMAGDGCSTEKTMKLVDAGIDLWPFIRILGMRIEELYKMVEATRKVG